MGFPHEVTFKQDNFQKPEMLNPKETIVQLVLNLFTMRPGNLPSLPHIGIDIRSYLYQHEEDIDIDGLKEKIFTQCSQLLTFISIGEVNAFVVEHEGVGMLIIILPLNSIEGAAENNLVMGFQLDKDNELLFNYQFEQDESSN